MREAREGFIGEHRDDGQTPVTPEVSEWYHHTDTGPGRAQDAAAHDVRQFLGAMAVEGWDRQGDHTPGRPDDAARPGAGDSREWPGEGEQE